MSPGSRVLEAAQAVLGHHSGPLPAVTVTWAQSSRGAIAAADGRPLALSGPESLLLTHRLRAIHDAILVGIATVRSDDPALSVRLLSGAPPQPQPVVLDSCLRFPPGARLLDRADRKPWIFCALDAGSAASLEARGARVFRVAKGAGGVDLYAVLRRLTGEGVRSLMVEGGASVLRSFLTAGFADQLVVTVSPSMAEGLNGPGIPALLEELSEQVGEDRVTWGSLHA